MIKICSLDFLNRSTFDVDIMSTDGRILVSAGSEATPEILLWLYYKEIYIAEPFCKSEDKPVEVDVVENIEDLNIIPSIDEIVDTNLDELLEFDEQQGQRVSQYSVKLGQRIGMKQPQLEELEKAAYYHNIGRIKLTVGDLSKKGFNKKQAEAGHKILIKEKNFSEKIAEAAMFYNRNCQSTKIDLNDSSYCELPYSHIVAITNYYDEMLIKGMDNDEALKKMLQRGGNKFNIFILHKFINMMKEANE